MREILFRGKRKDWNCWEIGNYSEYETYGGSRYYINGIEYEVFPETVGQYTGLIDKNGEKIFEGDIVKGKDRLDKSLEVYGYIDHKNGSFVIVGDFMTHYRWLDYEVEVIGNIHDNPELLKGDEEE